MATKPAKWPIPFTERYLLKISTPTNPFICCMNLEFDGKINHNALVKLCNEKWLKFDRLRSYIDEKQQYFVEIKNFDCNSQIKEINFNHPSTNDFISKYNMKIYYNIKFDSFAPVWAIHLLQFTNKSYLIVIMHHVIGDGATIFELLKILSGMKSNLTNNIKLYNNKSIFWSGKLFEYYPISPFIRVIYQLIKYEYDRCRYPNKKRFLEPLNGLKGRSTICILEMNDILLSKQRNKMIKNGKWPKHSFAHFLLCIVAETLIHFMKVHMQFTDEQIPNDILINQPCNLRPYYDNSKIETIFGNAVSSYFIYLPLNPKLPFDERLKLIKEQQDWCKYINEHHGTSNLLSFETMLPRSMLLKLFKFGGKRYPLTFSGFKDIKSKNWNILNRKCETFFTFLPTPAYEPLGFAYLMMPNRRLVISANLDVAVCGENGSKLLMNSMEYVLRKYDCYEMNRSML